MQRIAWFTAAALAACSSSPSPRGPTATGSGAGTASGAGTGATDAVPAAPPARVGDACAPDRERPQSTFPDGTLCAPLPGGYCTAQCTVTDCPTGSVCVPTGRMGDLCAAACQNDADCRADQGYVCDPGRHVCLLPFVASPSLAECLDEASPPPAPPRRRGFPPPLANFAPMEVLTSAQSPGAYQFEPAATVTPAGDLVILTSGGATSFMDPSFLDVIRVPASGAPVEQPLATGKRMHFDPWLTTDRRGTVHAVWLGHDGGGVDANAEIGYARSTDGGATWSTPVAIHDPADCPPDTPFCLDKPMIAAGPAPGKGKPRGDAVHVFYTAGEDEDGGMKLRTSVDGGATWGPSVKVIDGAYGDVAIDRGGGIHVAVAQATPMGPAAWGSPDNRVVYTRSTDGKTFSPPVAVSGPGESIPFYFVNPSVVTNATGRTVHVAYAAGTPDGKWNIMLATSRDGWATWHRRTLVGTDPACANHAVPELAMRPRGGLVVSWYEYAGGAAYRAYTTCTADGATCARPTPLGPPMATYELVRHSPRWVGEYAGLIADEAHHRLHAVSTQVVGDTPRGAARIVHTSAPLGPDR